MNQSSWRAPLSVTLVSVSVIAFQLVLMQVLSIAQWHHFAYMVISMAMLGFGAAGTVLVLWREALSKHYAFSVSLLYLACGASMAAAVHLAGLAGEFDVFLLFFDPGQTGLLLFSYLIYSLPFFFAGLAVTLVFYQETGRIGDLYFANMLGSGLGAALIVTGLWLLPLPWLPPVLALLPLGAAWLTRPRRRLFHGAFILAAAVIGTGAVNPVVPSPSQYKDISASLQLPGARIVHRAYSPYGRLDVVRADAQRFAPSLSLQYRQEPPVVDRMFNNGEYFGALLGRMDPGMPHILDFTTRALPYTVRDPGDVLVLNAATGTAVSHALHRGVGRVTAVEPNRHALALLRETHPEWIDGLYREPAVSVRGTGTRAYLAGARRDTHDLIVTPVLGAFGGTSGVDALQEKFHLTREAFRQMWNRLSDDGMISTTVWPDTPALASLRLLATWRELLDALPGVRPADHLLAVRSWGTVTFLLSKAPFTGPELARTRDFASDMGFDPLIMRGLQGGERQRFNRMEDSDFFRQVDTLVHGDPEALYERYAFDIRPARDTRPFFSQFMRWRTLGDPGETVGTASLPYMALGFILAGITFVQIVAVSVVLIILPLFRLGWQSGRRRWTFLYFAGTGTGYMFFEIALIQQLTLYLGNPVYSAAMVLAVLLISSGAGSYVSSSLEADRHSMLRTALLVTGLFLACAVFLMPVLGGTMGLPLPARLAVAFVLLALPGFFAGMMFPLGLRRLFQTDRSHIPWACGIDSCLSVTATALATLIALRGGIVTVTVIAGLAYAVCAVASLRLGSG